MSSHKNRAVFLDRDGVVVEHVHYLSKPEELRLVRGAAQAVRRLRAAGFKVVLVTNQSGVERGYFSLRQLSIVHRRLRAMLARGGARLDAIYCCPHAPAPKGRGCSCRKPAPALFKRAARRFKIDLASSFVVGDSTSDLKAARNIGASAVLVKTGYGGSDGRHRVRADKTCRDVAEASRWILKEAEGRP